MQPHNTTQRRLNFQRHDNHLSLNCSVSPHTHSSLCRVKAVVSEAPNPQIPISPSGPSRAAYPLLLSDPFKCSHSSPPHSKPACKHMGDSSTAIQRLSFLGLDMSAFAPRPQSELKELKRTLNHSLAKAAIRKKSWQSISFATGRSELPSSSSLLATRCQSCQVRLKQDVFYRTHTLS